MNIISQVERFHAWLTAATSDLRSFTIKQRVVRVITLKSDGVEATTTERGIGYMFLATFRFQNLPLKVGVRLWA